MKEKKVLFRSELQDEYIINKDHKGKQDTTEKSESIWTDTASNIGMETRTEHELPTDTQVLIIGGGMAGLLTAYQLQQKGIRAIVIERSNLGVGVTANTTAKITSLHGAVYEKIAKAYGNESAKKYYDIQEYAIREYKKIVDALHIGCDYEQKSHIMYATKDFDALRKEYEFQKNIGIPVEWTDCTPLPVPTVGGIIYRNQAQFHPMRFIQSLCSKLTVYTNCEATRIDSDGTVEVNHSHEIKADAIVIATHYPIINSKGVFIGKLSQERSYAVALKSNQGFDLHDMYIDMDERGHSFRMYQDYLVVALGNHRTGEKKLPAYYKQLEGECSRWYPDATITHRWSNQDCMSLDHIPYIGQYSKSLPNIYVATGFNQWGMSNSMVAALVLRDLIVTGESEYKDLFSPSRSMITGAGTFVKNGAISAVHLTKQWFHVKSDELDEIKNGHAGIIKENGQTIGVYRDLEGELHCVDTRCPHLGCQVQWNANEKTWDCPCHGSRFDMDGCLIENPAQNNLDPVCHLNHKK